MAKKEAEKEPVNVEAVRNEEETLTDRVVQLRNEKTRLEKEIDLLRIRYEDRQHSFKKQADEFVSHQRADTDKINRQLVDNKAKEDRLNKTQSEVNQIRAQIEKDVQVQKDLLLRKEVELDQKLDEVKKIKADLAERLASAKK